MDGLQVRQVELGGGRQQHEVLGAASRQAGLRALEGVQRRHTGPRLDCTRTPTGRSVQRRRLDRATLMMLPDTAPRRCNSGMTEHHIEHEDVAAA